MQTAVPCMLIRGGTSKGAYFLARDLPADEATLRRVLLAALGSPDARQIDGIGGADTLTSKAAIVSPASTPDAHVDYSFAQVSVDRPLVDTSLSCGNLLAGVPAFAIETGLIRARHPETRVMIHAVNTRSLVEAVVRTPHGQPLYEGNMAIDGVPRPGAPVLLNYSKIVGCKTGSLLPTGSVRDVFWGIEATCIDVAVPLVIIAAAELGRQGDETPEELNADRDLFGHLERIRRAAALKMGLGDVRDAVIPKLALISAPAADGGIRSRYFVPHACHVAHAVTGAIAVACCALLPGSVADGLARVHKTAREVVRIEHPSGSLDIELQTEPTTAGFVLRQAGLIRTARPLFRGNVLIPSSIWAGPAGAPAEDEIVRFAS